MSKCLAMKDHRPPCQPPADDAQRLPGRAASLLAEHGMPRSRQQMQRHALKTRRIQLMLHRQHALAAITHRINLFALYHNCANGTTLCNSARTPDDSHHTPDVSPKSSKVGAFLTRPPPFGEKISVSGHQKRRKGTNPIRLNDAIPSFLPIRRSTFVYTALYSDILSV